MRTRIVYRSYGGENLKNRPPYYSKLVALQSLLRAAERAGAELHFLNDGPLPGELLALMHASGEVVALDGTGMRHSYLSALRLPGERGWPDDDLVWFSEDDYLYTPDAFTQLADAAAHLPADYFALFGGSEEYPVFPESEDGWTPRGWDPRSFETPAGQRWVQILSTASSFGVRVGALRADMPIFVQGLLPHRRMLRDHDTCVVLQGYEPHSWRELGRQLVGRTPGTARDRARAAALAPFAAALNLRSHRRPARRRLLLAAAPNLATHMEIEWTAPGRDWERVAAETVAWAGNRDAPPPVPAGPPSTGPRVLVVESSLRDNGGLRVSLENARRWRAAGARTEVAVLQDVDDGPLARPDPAVPLRFLTPPRSRFRHTWPLALGRLVARARRSDVVLAGSEIGFGLLLSFAAARLARRPFAVLVQADLDEAIATWVPRPLRRPTRWVHSRADAAICVAESIVPGVVRNGLPAARAHVVVNGIDVGRIRAMAGLGPVGAQPDPAAARTGPPTVVGHGRLSPQKDFALLIRAHARVRAAGLDHRLVILGEGPSRPELEALVAELGVAGSAELPGFVDNPYRWTSTADLFVLSSRSEGMPLTLLEAMAVGAPIVATRCGSGTELLLDGGEHGELVAAGSVEELAAAIERHLRDPRALRARGATGPGRALGFDAAGSARAGLEVVAGLTTG